MYHGDIDMGHFIDTYLAKYAPDEIESMLLESVPLQDIEQWFGTVSTEVSSWRVNVSWWSAFTALCSLALSLLFFVK